MAEKNQCCLAPESVAHQQWKNLVSVDELNHR
jgi:hypothetical protein